MGFKANWSEAAQPDSLKPEGDYECLIAKAEERDYTNSKGEEKTCLNISFVIRNDVEQGVQKRLYLPYFVETQRTDRERYAGKRIRL